MDQGVNLVCPYQVQGMLLGNSSLWEVVSKFGICFPALGRELLSHSRRLLNKFNPKDSETLGLEHNFLL